MKKLLAVLMAALLLCSTLVIGASALTYKGVYEIQNDEILIILNFNGGSSKVPITYLDLSTGTENVDTCEGSVAIRVKEGTYFQFPSVKAPEEKTFDAWVNESNLLDNRGAGSYIEAGKDNQLGNYYVYNASYSPAEVGPSTLDTIKNILIKVFGVILGLFYGDMDYGQELVANLFSAILG